MFRRFNTSLLMMAYFASQLAMVPHAHGTSESQPCDHHARPHVHISWWSHGSHSHESGHSHQNDFDDSRSHSTSGDMPIERDHDSDAIYLSNEAGVPSLGRIVVSQDNLPLLSALAIVDIALPTTTLRSWRYGDFPDNGKPSCPLYLALRALRI
jgi:hypothetical protein